MFLILKWVDFKFYITVMRIYILSLFILFQMDQANSLSA